MKTIDSLLNLRMCVTCWFLVKREIELDVTVLWESMLRFRKKPVQETEIETKSCRDCAYLNESAGVFGPRFDFSMRGVGKTVGKPTAFGLLNCKIDGSSIGKNELNSRFCEKFMRKKEGMALEQQIEEEKQQKAIEEKERLVKEQKRFSNRLRRNWYYVSALTISLILLTIAVW